MPRKRLTSIAARALLLSGFFLFLAFPAVGGPSSWFSAYAGPDRLQIAFTPHVTQVGWTVTPQPTIPGSLQPQISPVPLALTPTPPGPTGPTPAPAISGGDESIGYDFIEGSDPPLWRIWYNGQELVISPQDPADSALLNAFMAQADRAARAAEDIDASTQDLHEAIGTGVFGGLATVGGTITAILSCATVPLTFWAAGGTGWTCAGGVVAAVGGGGAVLVSAGQGFRAAGDRDQAQRERDQALEEVEDLFTALQGTPSP